MFEAFLQGLVNVFHPMTFALVLLGVALGIIVGVLPAINGLTGMALLLPIIYGMDPLLAFPFLLGLGTVALTGGSLTAILLNIPGDSPNAATLIDGYPMTRKGEAGRAIGASLTAGATGGFVGVAMALVTIPLIVPLVLSLYMAEMFFVVLVGLSFVAILAEGGRIKGLISGGLGLLLAFVGFHTATGIPRYTFSMSFLSEGVGVIPVVIGLFAGAEIIDLAVSGQTIALVKVAATPWRQMLEGAKDIFRHAWLWFRSSVIGYIVGVMPGIGSMGAVFVAYAQAKQTSKRPEKFGTGCVEGVIAPETASHACHAGDLLTTLAFGIPGSSSMAILLAAYILVGIKPGPGLLTEHTALAFTMLWTVAIASVLASVICLPIVPFLLRLTTIHPNYLFASIAALTFVSVYVAKQTLADVILVLIFTGLGLLMRRLGYSRPALVLGFVLGNMFESYFWLALHLQGPLFFLRPISLALIALLIALFTFNSIRAALGRLRTKRAA